MTSDAALASSVSQPERTLPVPAKLPRVWPAVVLVGLFWTYYFVARGMEMSTFVRFASRMGVCALLTLTFTIWWLFNRRRSWTERLFGLGGAIAGGVIAALLTRDTFGTFGLLLMAPPWVFTAWMAWLVVVRGASVRTRCLGLPVVLLLTWGVFTLIRIEGIDGEQVADYRWRWSPTAEELYLAERTQKSGKEADALSSASSRDGLAHQTGDWPGFRGPKRDSAVRGIQIATDWKTTSPRLVWRQRVGPGWSSIAVVDDRLFTQEQRGESEAVVCLNAVTGREVWAHQDAVRFWESVAGAGPRATPTFANGRIYSLGATGILNCLDAATGERKWSRDIAADSGAKPPLWGFSSSPLVVQGVVVVFAGGDGEKNLLAYRLDSGEPAWTATAGQISYASAQLASLGGEEQILFLSDRGLLAVDPASGKVLWEHGVPAPGAPRSIQPHLVGPTQVLISSELDLGTAFLDVKRDGQTWTPSQRWASRDLKPSFNDFVVHEGSIYGFDGATFCCVDVQTGQRRWKEGNYGHGQVLLLADQSLLLVLSEKGEVILLAANPGQSEELSRFRAIKGKTWNHPTIAHGRLYVRNGEEMACYELRRVTSR